MKKVAPIFTVDLIEVLDQKLIALLRSLNTDDWSRQTVASQWQIKDIVTHLLDGTLRNLSISRDGFWGPPPQNINSYQDLVRYLNQLNADWVNATKRLSSTVLIDLLELTNQQYSEHLKTLNPYEKAIFSVAWAGEDESPTWFHIAREYTEKWHHQQQIRLAVGSTEALLTQELYYPFLDTSMRALPYHYQAIEGTQGDVIRFMVTGEGGGSWFLHHNGQQWELCTECEIEPISTIAIEGSIAWLIFTKGINRSKANEHVMIEGKPQLAEKILEMLAIMA